MSKIYTKSFLFVLNLNKMQLRLLFSLLFCGLLLSGFSQTSVGLIGSATPNGWDSDIDMVQSPDSAHLWSLDIALTQGACKFRQDNAWDINWGSNTFPTGVGTQGGPDIPIPAAGNFTVKFNSLTGAYSFVVKSDIGLIGSATPNGWDSDVNMFQSQVDTNEYTLTINLVVGDCKFRQNDGWDVNWGAVDFPTGVGTQAGANIPVPAAGKYAVTFNKSTGAYSFTEVVEFNTIGLIGDATPGGWGADTYFTRDAGNPNLWKLGSVVLTEGALKFRANGAWTINWGGGEFPTDTATVNGDNIAVSADAAGEYQVTFNTETLIYNFLEIGNYTSVGIIGDATPGGWDTDTDMEQDPTDKSIWRKRLILTTGEAKFRADNDWAVNWGAGEFPTGTATLDGANIPVPAGEYKITFNSTTGEYNFELLVIYSTVGIIGDALPDQWNSDVDMTKDAVDEFLWVHPSIDLATGFVKFRAENAWAVNWGATNWPSGVGTQDGPNIPVTGGTYRASIHTATGEYSFTEPSSTVNLLDNNTVRIAPNPAKDVVNIEINAPEMQGDVRVILFNAQGKQVIAQNMNIQNVAKINVADLAPGSYFLHLSNGKYIVGKNVVVVK